MKKIIDESRLTIALSAAVIIATLSFMAAPFVRGYFPVEKWWQNALQKAPLQNVIQRAQQVRNAPEIIQEVLTFTPQPKPLSSTEVAQVVQLLRSEAKLPALTADPLLNDYSRLLTLEAEDLQMLDLPNPKLILKALTLTPPSRVEIVMLFSSDNNTSSLSAQLASEAAIMDKGLTRWGLATRSATYRDVPGTIVAITLSPAAAKTTAKPAASPTPLATFTGQDLWSAVNAYRSSHSLSQFEMSPELCTVASIRLNELLELGKLDNHAGFDARSKEFFEKNPGWRTINENLAAGYSNATQTVEWGWDQSLGHQALIQSRDYPKACTAANRGFAVLITGR